MSKQYILLCDEVGKEALEKILRPEGLQFLEVQGMTMNGNTHNVLVTPVLAPVTPMPVPQPPPPAAPAENIDEQ